VSDPTDNAQSSGVIGKPFTKDDPRRNAGGRPRMSDEMREMLKAATPKAIKTLIDCLDEPDGRVRIQAANSLLDRLYGKPSQAITDEDGKPLRIGVVVLPPETD
jgi:hypothetical protein